MTPGSQQPHQLNICGEPAVIEDCPYCDGSGKRVRPRYIPGSSPHPAASEQDIRADERKKVLDELNVWRLKRMNGMLKKDVWIGWNEETDLIEQLRRQPPSQQGWGEA